MKSQTIRILDAVLIGPLMMYSGIRTAQQRPLPGYALAFLGAATLLYNGQNWLRYRELGRQMDKEGRAIIHYEGHHYEVKKL